VPIVPNSETRAAQNSDLPGILKLGEDISPSQCNGCCVLGITDMHKILIVDDDVTLQAALHRYLSHRNFDVLQAGTGAEGLERFAAQPADLVVSDVMMPTMDGFTFCEQLRACQEGQLVPFIFLSSRGELDARVHGHLIGADDYLIKPFEPRELLAKIEAQLERSQRFQKALGRQQSQPSPSVSEIAPTPLPLTPGEMKVFLEVLKGGTNREIGERLIISPRTVQTHLSNILSKLDLSNRSQLVRFGYEHGYSGSETISVSGG
jgi:DNA-binding response OmpR family regulator